MTKEEKEKFLAIETYEEFDKRRMEFESLTMRDEEVREHVRKIFPRLQTSNEELYKTLPSQGGSIGR